MRFMEMIRKKGSTCLGVFLVVFLVSVFAGLGVGAFSFKSCEMAQPEDESQPFTQKLVTDQPGLANAMLTVNGQAVEEQEFFEKVSRLMQNRQGDNPGLELQAYGAAAFYSISEIVIAQKGVELGVEVTVDDLRELKDQAIEQYLNVDEGSTGNIIGDYSKRLGTNREKKAAFNQYLMSRGLTEDRWNKQARQEKLQTMTQEAWQQILDDEKALEAGVTKADFDQRLAAGESFEDLAQELSEDPTVESTGVVEPMWISRGLVTKEQEEAAFACSVGEVTDWIEVAAGWSRFKVLEYKKAEGPEFEKERASIVTSLKSGNEDYEPTAEQIARQYEQVNVVQVLLKTSTPGSVNKLIEELIEQADVQLNNPYLLAFQALNEDKLQPPAGWDRAKLQSIAEMAAVGEGYDFELIQQRLDRAAELKAGAAKTAGTAATDPTAAADATDTTDTAAAADAAGAADATAPVEEAPAVDPADEEPTPLYALAIGLFELAIQDKKDPAGYFPYYIIGRTYLDWLGDDAAQAQQPIDRDAARAEIETQLARAAERYDYSAMLHASRGLNLAWLGRKEDALASLDLAMKYTPSEYENPVFADIRQGYEILDAQDKLAELDQKLTTLRQAQLQQMIEQMQQGEGGNQGNMISIPGGSDLDEVLDGAESGGTADGGGAADEAGTSGDSDTTGESGDTGTDTGGE